MSGVLETNLKSLPFLHRGKVRDIYAVGEDHLLVIQTDRLSAFDVILDDPLFVNFIAMNAKEVLLRKLIHL